jgi:hypothetical protein
LLTIITEIILLGNNNVSICNRRFLLVADAVHAVHAAVFGPEAKTQNKQQ